MVDRSFWWYESQLCEKQEQLLGFDCFGRPEPRPPLFTVPDEAGGEKNNGER